MVINYKYVVGNLNGSEPEPEDQNSLMQQELGDILLLILHQHLRYCHVLDYSQINVLFKFATFIIIIPFTQTHKRCSIVIPFP